MKKTLFIFLFVLSFAGPCFSQPPYQQAMGGPGGEWPEAIIETYDGGLVSSGNTTSYGTGTDIYVVKTDSAGALLWTRVIGGAGYESASFGLHQTADSGIILSANTNSFGAGGYDFLLVKLSRTGNFLWARTIGGPGDESATDAILTSDGGYCMTGNTKSFGAGASDVYVVKLDAAGNLQWTRTIGGPANDYAMTMVQTKDGGYAIDGHTYSYGAGLSDGYYIKLNAAGAVQWTRVIGGAQDDNPRHMIGTFDNGFAVNGWTYSYGSGINDLHVIKLDSAGNIQWNKVIGGPGIDYGWGIVQCPDSGYAICGSTTSFGTGNDAYALKLSKTGQVQWSTTFGVGAICTDIIRTHNNNYAVIGYTFNFGAGSADFYQALLDANGSTCMETGNGAIVMQGASVASGGVSGSGGVVNTWTPSVTSGGILTPFCPVVGMEESRSEKTFFYPNPSSGIFSVRNVRVGETIRIYNVMGREIFFSALKAPDLQLDLSAQPAGIYFYRIASDQKIIASGKLVVR